MDMNGEYRIPAPRNTVWEALNDPEILKQCIGGCEEIAKTSDTEFTAKVVAKVGPVKAAFSGKVTLSHLDPPAGYTITGEGSGGVAGFGKGGADIRLTEDDGGAITILAYTAHASVGGKLAQIGSRLVDSTARKMADDFFSRFADIVGTPPQITPPKTTPGEPAAADIPVDTAEAAPEPAGPAAALPPVSGDPDPRSRGLPPALWIGGLIAIVAVLLLLFGR